MHLKVDSIMMSCYRPVMLSTYSTGMGGYVRMQPLSMMMNDIFASCHAGEPSVRFYVLQNYAGFHAQLGPGSYNEQSFGKHRALSGVHYCGLTHCSTWLGSNSVFILETARLVLP